MGQSVLLSPSECQDHAVRPDTVYDTPRAESDIDLVAHTPSTQIEVHTHTHTHTNISNLHTPALAQRAESK